jgi:hypothetical protein
VNRVMNELPLAVKGPQAGRTWWIGHGRLAWAWLSFRSGSDADHPGAEGGPPPLGGTLS